MNEVQCPAKCKVHGVIVLHSLPSSCTCMLARSLFYFTNGCLKQFTPELKPSRYLIIQSKLLVHELRLSLIPSFVSYSTIL